MNRLKIPLYHNKLLNTNHNIDQFIYHESDIDSPFVFYERWYYSSNLNNILMIGIQLVLNKKTK